jgi:hypothetical protein
MGTVTAETRCENGLMTPAGAANGYRKKLPRLLARCEGVVQFSDGCNEPWFDQKKSLHVGEFKLSRVRRSDR